MTRLTLTTCLIASAFLACADDSESPEETADSGGTDVVATDAGSDSGQADSGRPG